MGQRERPFEALSQGGQVRRLRRLAEVALRAYPLREHLLWRDGWPVYVTRALQTLQTFAET
jgi:hypothetical protein